MVRDAVERLVVGLDGEVVDPLGVEDQAPSGDVGPEGRQEPVVMAAPRPSRCPRRRTPRPGTRTQSTSAGSTSRQAAPRLGDAPMPGTRSRSRSATSNRRSRLRPAIDPRAGSAACPGPGPGAASARCRPPRGRPRRRAGPCRRGRSRGGSGAAGRAPASWPERSSGSIARIRATTSRRIAAFAGLDVHRGDPRPAPIDKEGPRPPSIARRRARASEKSSTAMPLGRF